MKGISRLLNKKCKRFKHHIRNILQNDIANKYIKLHIKILFHTTQKTCI